MAIDSFQSTPPRAETETRPHNFETFQIVSGASTEEVQQLREVFRDLSDLPADPYEAAKAVRDYLVDKGFEYDEQVFKLQDILKSKRANCLGLTLLYGSVLQEKGIEVDCQMILNPHDDTFAADQKMFEDLYSGMYFGYDEVPNLPKQQAEYPTFRFIPLEHPRLLLGGKTFETTVLAKDEPEKAITAEVETNLSYSQVASAVYIDRVRDALGDEELFFGKDGGGDGQDIKADPQKLDQMKTLCEKALAMWPGNREALNVLRIVNRLSGDSEGEKDVVEKYKSTNGQDSRFFFNLYSATHDEKYLDAALKKFEHPEKGGKQTMDHILAFFEKYVVLNKDTKDARFNFAVAAWCISNSVAFNILEFYRTNQEVMIKLFGQETVRKLIGKSTK